MELGHPMDKFNTYDDYLNVLVSTEALFYLDDEVTARHLVELGYRSTKKVLSRKQYLKIKDRSEIIRLGKLRTEIPCHHRGVVIKDPLMRELAKREYGNRSGDLNTIIFVRGYNRDKQEVSGFIDFAHRLRTENWTPYYKGEKKLQPRHSDLSYYNWNTLYHIHNPSPNFLPRVAKGADILYFKSPKDRKLLDADPQSKKPGLLVRRYHVPTPYYAQAALFDRPVREKLEQ